MGKQITEPTTSQRVRTSVLNQVVVHVKDKGIAPMRFLENAGLQKIVGGNPDWTFRVGEKIKNEKGQFVCVCADDSMAIFAPFVGKKTKYNGMIALSNLKMFADTHDYKRI